MIESEGDPRDLGDTWDETMFDASLTEKKASKSGGLEPERRRSSGRNVRARVSSHTLVKKPAAEATQIDQQQHK